MHELVGLAFQFCKSKSQGEKLEAGDYLVGVKDKKGIFTKLLIQKVSWERYQQHVIPQLKASVTQCKDIKKRA